MFIEQHFMYNYLIHYQTIGGYMIDLNFKLERSYPPKRRVSTFKHGNINCYDFKNNCIFNTYLVDKMGMPNTRVSRIGRAVKDLHYAIACCDLEHAKKLTDLTVGELVNLFGEAEELYIFPIKDD